MFYRYGGSFIGTMTETTNRWVKMYQSPKLEFVVNQGYAGECHETQFADVILPACTNLERNDISEWANCGRLLPRIPPTAATTGSSSINRNVLRP